MWADGSIGDYLIVAVILQFVLTLILVISVISIDRNLSKFLKLFKYQHYLSGTEIKKGGDLTRSETKKDDGLASAEARKGGEDSRCDQAGVDELR